MRTIFLLFVNVRGFVDTLRQMTGYLLTFCWALLVPKAVLAARLLAVESQLAAELNRSQGQKKRRRQFSLAFRVLWVLLSKFLQGWEDLVHLMKPETVKRWHTRAFRIFWRWRSKLGRPPVAPELQRLIRRISRENPLWGAERIRDTLLLLGYHAPSEESVRKYMIKPRKPRPKSAGWLPFLRNHLEVSWAIDFFTVTTCGFQILYVFLVLDHARRKVLRLAISSHPSMEWVIQQLREATPFGKQPRYLFRDNDQIFGYGVRAFLESCGIREVRTAHDSPWQNPYIERMIGTLRQELLNHVIVLDERHLERLLREYLGQYYHSSRPHQGLDGQTPLAQKKPRLLRGETELVSVPVVGGLHHRYYRAAA